MLVIPLIPLPGDFVYLTKVFGKDTEVYIGRVSKTRFGGSVTFEMKIGNGGEKGFSVARRMFFEIERA